MTGVKKSENEIRESHDDLGPVMLHNIHQNHPEKNGRDSWVSSGVTVSYSNKKTYITAWRMNTNFRSLSFTGLLKNAPVRTVFFFFFLARVP